MNETERLIKKVEDYLYEEYQLQTASSQQMVLRKENGTIRAVAEMAVEALKEDLKTTPDKLSSFSTSLVMRRRRFESVIGHQIENFL